MSKLQKNSVQKYQKSWKFGSTKFFAENEIANPASTKSSWWVFFLAHSPATSRYLSFFKPLLFMKINWSLAWCTTDFSTDMVSSGFSRSLKNWSLPLAINVLTKLVNNNFVGCAINVFFYVDPELILVTIEIFAT